MIEKSCVATYVIENDHKIKKLKLKLLKLVLPNPCELDSHKKSTFKSWVMKHIPNSNLIKTAKSRLNF